MAIERVARADDRVPLRRVLISVSDKSNLERFVRQVAERAPGVTFYSTGGTYSALQPIVDSLAGASLVAVSDYTGQPEMRGGLVKTLDYRIYLGLLSERYNADHQEDLRRLDGVAFDMTVVNLYPFERVVGSGTADLEDARGNIDIGGPAMLRASAKNFLRVLAVCDTADYPSVVDHLERNGGATRLAFRARCAQKVFAATAAYDGAIAAYLGGVDQSTIAGAYTLSDGSTAADSAARANSPTAAESPAAGDQEGQP